MRAKLLLALLPALAGCISANTTTTTRTAAVEAERLRALEARVATLEARPSDLDDEILAREVELAGMRTVYAADNPAVTALEARIRALGETRSAEQGARRERMARRLEVERKTLLVTHTAEHPSVRKLDAQIAFLRSDPR